jgi:gliding motility-associated-like protein
MSEFNEILKQKVEQFEVPYNDAHWAEMEGKLNAARTAKIKRNIFTSIGVVALLSVAAYYIIPNNSIQDNTQLTDNINTNNDEVINNVKKEKSSVNEENITIEKTQTDNNSVVEDEVTNNNVIENIVVANETEERNPIAISEEETKEDEQTNPIIEPIVKSEFIVFNNQVCLGETVSFESIVNDLPVSYKWNFGDGTVSRKANPTHIYKNRGTYTVSLSLINRQTGEEYPSSIQHDVVNILPSPQLSFTYSEESKKNDDNVLKYPYTTFNVKDVDTKTKYKWSFENGETSSAVKASAIYKKKGVYAVTLIAINAYGCENKTTQKVTIKNNTNLFVQNAFSPNGDGNNETFIPSALQEWDVQFEMTIFDKLNNPVFKTTDQYNPWNGKLNNTGSILEQGVYFWQITTQDAKGKTHTHSGRVNLIK